MTTGNDQIPSLGDAVTAFLKKLPDADKGFGQPALFKFARWIGWDLSFTRLAPPAVAGYAEQLSPSDTDYQKKLELIRSFFAFAKKSGWSPNNLGTHVKTRKSKARRAKSAATRQQQETITLSKERHAEMVAELAVLKERSRELVGEIQRAAADKDFRENAPLHAAKEERGHVEGRLRELEGALKVATIHDSSKPASAKSGVGDRLLLCDLESGEDCRYIIVDPREVDALKGKISIASPLGKALLGKREGDTVKFKAPAGTLQFLIKSIER
ncbi:MAG: GreA/GreB family elongation factor [Dehalococcoidales bacterium]|nr:GreA/GreB family elongation factor [Dehalococcoidales bacterium]